MQVKCWKCLRGFINKYVYQALPTHAIDERFQQEVGESTRRIESVFCLLQLLQNPQFYPLHSRDGIRDHRARLEVARIASSVILIEQQLWLYAT